YFEPDEEASIPILQHITKRLHRIARIPDRFGEGIIIERVRGTYATSPLFYNEYSTDDNSPRIAGMSVFLSHPLSPNRGGDTVYPLGHITECLAEDMPCCHSRIFGPLRIPPKLGRGILQYNTELDGTSSKGTEVGDCPLSSPDDDMWLLHRYFRASPYYNVLGAMDPRHDGLPSSGGSEAAAGDWRVISQYRPRIYMTDNFLTPEECQHLIGLAENNLTLGRIGGGGGGVADDDIRSSWQFYTGANDSLTDMTLRAILKRFQRAARIPDKFGETLQIGRYEKGQKYEIHHDSTPGRGSAMWRPATIIVYLSDVEEGGHTIFIPFNDERCRPLSLCCQKDEVQGTIRIPPKLGRAVLFYSYDLEGRHDPASRHAACPVIKGTKWITQRWFQGTDFEDRVHELDPRHDGLPGMTDSELRDWDMEHVRT
ncbi:hypothetical protein FOL47_005039, partial [Perkinsus chesapeaki]